MLPNARVEIVRCQLVLIRSGSAEAALGQWYAKVPGLFGGDNKKAEAHFRRAIAINPESRTALVNLGDLLIDEGHKDEARTLLQRAIDAPIDPVHR